MTRPAIALPLLLAGLAACGKAQPAAPPAKAAVPVVTAVAAVRDLPLRRSAIGEVAASELVVVHPQVTAVLTAVRFAEGGTVAAGAPLFGLDDRAFAAAVGQAEAEAQRARAAERQAAAVLERDQAQLSVAEADAARTATLEREAVVTAQAGEQARAALRAAQANIAADEAAIATAKAVTAAGEAALVRARLDLSWCTVTAPIAGRTGALGITAGNLATAGQTALVTIVRTQPIHVGFSLPADVLPALRAAQARGPLAVSVLAEGADAPETGTLELVDNQIDPATATVRLRALCANASERLWPGQRCEVELTLGSDDHVVTVPETAVQVGQRGPIVWVVAADRTASPRPVVVARTAEGVAIISSGVSAGDTVVVDGQLRLSKGAAITAAAPTADGPAAPEKSR